MVRHIQSWDGSILSAHSDAHPVDTSDDQLPEGALVIDKKQSLYGISIARAGGGFPQVREPFGLFLAAMPDLRRAAREWRADRLRRVHRRRAAQQHFRPAGEPAHAAHDARRGPTTPAPTTVPGCRSAAFATPTSSTSPGPNRWSSESSRRPAGSGSGGADQGGASSVDYRGIASACIRKISLP
jgi:hypothetical protein